VDQEISSKEKQSLATEASAASLFSLTYERMRCPDNFAWSRPILDWEIARRRASILNLALTRLTAFTCIAAEGIGLPDDYYIPFEKSPKDYLKRFIGGLLLLSVFLGTAILIIAFILRSLKA
jgi:hypothetical protein